MTKIVAKVMIIALLFIKLA